MTDSKLIFIEKYKNKHPELYNDIDWAKFEYNKISTYSTIIHKSCNTEIEITPKKLLSTKKFCTVCNKNNNGKKIKDTAYFLKRYADKYPSRVNEIEFLEPYNGSATLVKVIHKPCGSILPHIPEKLLYGRFCKKCYGAVTTFSHEHFINEYSNKYPDRIKELEFIIPYTKRHTYCRVKHIKCGFEWDVTPNNLIQGKFCPKCMSGGISHKEFELHKFIKSIYKGNIILNNKSIIYPQEIDIYLPDLKIAIEFNGLYWHSETKLGKNYHYDKTIKCAEAGIRLIHIFENEWQDPNLKEILKSKLTNILGVCNNKIYARKCIIKKITPSMKNDFLHSNHLQGKDISFYNLGLYHKDELVSVMTFCKPRLITNSLKNENVVELSRFCSLKNNTVVGGFSKLFKYAINDLKKININKVSTYANLRYSEGDVYLKNGFDLVRISSPSYWYFTTQCNKTDKLLHRSTFMKHKLKDILLIYDESKTEYENMKANKFDRVWDCGNIVLEYNI